MDIVRITTDEHNRYIPLQGLDNVEKALNIHASGYSRGSRDTETHQLRAVAESSGGIAMAYYGIASSLMRGSPSEFVKQRIMAGARMSLPHRDSCTESFDYDGQGSFFKTTVEIEALDREADLYGLGIHAAYVGDKPEQGLAEYLQISRCLIWASATVETQPVDSTHFEFDFHSVLRKLDKVIFTDWAPGFMLTDHMMSGDRYESPDPFVLEETDEFRVTLGLGAVEHRFVYPRGGGQPKDTWSADGGLLRGDLDESYDTPGTYRPPTFVITIHSAKEHGYKQRKPIWDADMKERAIQLRDQIADALRA